MSTPVTILIYSSTMTLLATAEVEYSTLPNLEPEIAKKCSNKGYSYIVKIPHTERSLMVWLDK
jgi:hypothetical protein